MKKIIVSVAAISMFATASFAGSPVMAPEPEMEPMVEVVPEETGGSLDSSGGLLVPLLALVAIGLLISSSDSSTSTTS